MDDTRPWHDPRPLHSHLYGHTEPEYSGRTVVPSLYFLFSLYFYTTVHNYSRDFFYFVLLPYRSRPISTVGLLRRNLVSESTSLPDSVPWGDTFLLNWTIGPLPTETKVYFGCKEFHCKVQKGLDKEQRCKSRSKGQSRVSVRFVVGTTFWL